MQTAAPASNHRRHCPKEQQRGEHWPGVPHSTTPGHIPIALHTVQEVPCRCVTAAAPWSCLLQLHTGHILYVCACCVVHRLKSQGTAHKQKQATAIQPRSDRNPSCTKAERVGDFSASCLFCFGFTFIQSTTSRNIMMQNWNKAETWIIFFFFFFKSIFGSHKVYTLSSRLPEAGTYLPLVGKRNPMQTGELWWNPVHHCLIKTLWDTFIILKLLVATF